MDNLESYRISLPGSGLCPLSVQNLVYSHMGGGQASAHLYPCPIPRRSSRKSLPSQVRSVSRSQVLIPGRWKFPRAAC